MSTAAAGSAGFWDARADAWAAPGTRTAAFWHRRSRLAAALVLRHAPPGPILDAGCGTGLALRLLAERGADVLGVDPAPAMVARALGAVAGAVDAPGERLRVAEADGIPADGRFARPLAAVLLLGTLAYVPDAGATLARLAARLAPGGIVVATGLQRASPFVAFELARRAAGLGPAVLGDPGTRALLRTGLWSGGGGDPATGRGAPRLDRLAAAAGLVPVERCDLWGPGLGALDRMPERRGALARAAARRLAWCPMAVYRAGGPSPASAGGQRTGKTAGSV